MNPEYLIPQWPLPGGVRAIVTTRKGGVSEAPYHSNNLASHVGDAGRHVAMNREALCQSLGITALWINQTHSTRVWLTNDEPLPSCCDASITAVPGNACVVLTADCLPVLLCSEQGSEVAAVHAGWRGLAAGILPRVLQRMKASGAGVSAYLGPAISQPHFEVGRDVLDAFILAERSRLFAEPVANSFVAGHAPDKYFADLYRLARAELRGLGVGRIYGGDLCTYSDEAHFYSYRRDGTSGRMASMIWIEPGG